MPWVFGAFALSPWGGGQPRAVDALGGRLLSASNWSRSVLVLKASVAESGREHGFQRERRARQLLPRLALVRRPEGRDPLPPPLEPPLMPLVLPSPPCRAARRAG